MTSVKCVRILVDSIYILCLSSVLILFVIALSIQVHILSSYECYYVKTFNAKVLNLFSNQYTKDLLYEMYKNKICISYSNTVLYFS